MEAEKNRVPFNKYELRSNDVQEVMNNPPHIFITWGNIFILTILCTLFFLLNMFKVHEKVSIPIEVSEVKEDIKSDSVIIILIFNSTISKKIKKGQSAMLLINAVNGILGEPVLAGRIDSIAYTRFHAPILFFNAKYPSSSVQPGMFGVVKIITSEKSLFSMLFDRLKF